MLLPRFLQWIAFGIFILEGTDGTSLYSDCECGRSNNPLKSRIINGERTEPHDYPWVVALFDENNYVYCGGSIISDRHILTAAHCPYYKKNPFDLMPVVGMHDRKAKGLTKYTIEAVYYHPKFTPYEAFDDYDMSILEINGRFMFNDYVRPVCLPQFGQDHSGLKAKVAGWGRIVPDRRSSPRYLQETTLKVFSPEMCSQNTLSDVFQSDSMICAYTNKTDACQGDSGGPLFLETSFNRYEQIGVVSFGIGCAEELPGIYGKVSNAVNWINDVIAKSHNAGTCLDPDVKEQLKKYNAKHPA